MLARCSQRETYRPVTSPLHFPALFRRPSTIDFGRFRFLRRVVSNGSAGSHLERVLQRVTTALSSFLFMLFYSRRRRRFRSEINHIRQVNPFPQGGFRKITSGYHFARNHLARLGRERGLMSPLPHAMAIYYGEILLQCGRHFEKRTHSCDAIRPTRFVT